MLGVVYPKPVRSQLDFWKLYISCNFWVEFFVGTHGNFSILFLVLPFEHSTLIFEHQIFSVFRKHYSFHSPQLWVYCTDSCSLFFSLTTFSHKIFLAKISDCVIQPNPFKYSINLKEVWVTVGLTEQTCCEELSWLDAKTLCEILFAITYPNSYYLLDKLNIVINKIIIIYIHPKYFDIDYHFVCIILAKLLHLQWWMIKSF